MDVRGAIVNLCDLVQGVSFLELGHWCYWTQGGWNMGRGQNMEKAGTEMVA